MKETQCIHVPAHSQNEMEKQFPSTENRRGKFFLTGLTVHVKLEIWLLLFLGCFCFTAHNVIGGDGLLAYYAFSQDGDITPTENDPDVIAGDFQISHGSVSFQSYQSDTWDGVMPYAYGSTSYDGDSFDNSKFFSFNLTPDNGVFGENSGHINLDQLSFQHRVTSAGPQAFGWSINGQLQDEGVIEADHTDNVLFLSSYEGAPGESLLIGIHGWGGGGGQHRINDVRLEGSVIPEPSVGLLLTAGLSLLALRRFT